VGTTLDRSRRAAGLRTVTVDEQIDRAAGGPVPGRHQIPPPPRPVLDPFGLGLPFDVIVDIFAGRRAGQYVPVMGPNSGARRRDFDVPGAAICDGRWPGAGTSPIWMPRGRTRIPPTTGTARINNSTTIGIQRPSAAGRAR
jgi:hypothetical protein